MVALLMVSFAGLTDNIYIKGIAFIIAGIDAIRVIINFIKSIAPDDSKVEKFCNKVLGVLETTQATLTEKKLEIEDKQEMKYPTNVRFAQRLTDLGLTPQAYFEITDNDEIGAQFADAIYKKFYAAEIGLEELDIFDLKCKGRFKVNYPVFKSLYETRERLLSSEGAEQVIKHSGQDITEYGGTLASEVKKDTTNTVDVVYQEVSDSTTEKTSEKLDTKGGADTVKFGRVETVDKSGSPDYYAKLYELTSDIFERFAELFSGLFMEVL